MLKDEMAWRTGSWVLRLGPFWVFVQGNWALAPVRLVCLCPRIRPIGAVSFGMLASLVLLLVALTWTPPPRRMVSLLGQCHNKLLTPLNPCPTGPSTQPSTSSSRDPVVLDLDCIVDGKSPRSPEERAECPKKSSSLSHLVLDGVIPAHWWQILRHGGLCVLWLWFLSGDMRRPITGIPSLRSVVGIRRGWGGQLDEGECPDRVVVTGFGGRVERLVFECGLV